MLRFRTFTQEGRTSSFKIGLSPDDGKKFMDNIKAFLPDGLFARLWEQRSSEQNGRTKRHDIHGKSFPNETNILHALVKLLSENGIKTRPVTNNGVNHG